MQPNTNYSPDSQVKSPRGKTSSLLRKHHKKIIVVLVLLGGLLVAWQVLSQQAGLIPVSTAEVSQNKFEQNVFASGKLAVKDLSELKSKSKTIVENLLVEPGDKVTKGQVILKMETSNLSVEVSQKLLACEELRAKIINTESSIRLLRETVVLAEKDYENTKILMESGAASPKELEQAEHMLTEAKEKLVVEEEANLPLLKAQLKQAEVIHGQAQEDLAKATLVSPQDGLVLNLIAKAGQEVEPGSLLAQIGNPANLQIETGINEVDAAQLSIGDKVEITNNALLSEPLMGSIEAIAPTAEVVSTAQGEQTQVKIKISVPEGETPLKPGYNVNLKVTLNQKEEALLLPLEALIEGDGQKLVYAVGSDGIVSEREVQVGLSNELFAVIISGLQVGEKVILNPDEQIKDGVQVMTDDQSK
ncbi:MAG: efflux RND transporter periplasmic adaptor subunit [Desulfitobacterium sp.]